MQIFVLSWLVSKNCNYFARLYFLARVRLKLPNFYYFVIEAFNLTNHLFSMLRLIPTFYATIFKRQLMHVKFKVLIINSTAHLNLEFTTTSVVTLIARLNSFQFENQRLWCLSGRVYSKISLFVKKLTYIQLLLTD